MNLIEACKQNDVTRIRDLIKEGTIANIEIFTEFNDEIFEI